MGQFAEVLKVFGRWRTAGAVAAIVLAALAAYGHSFTGPFVLDDAADIADNPTIRRLWPITPVLSPPGASGLTVSGRPVLNLSLALNYALSGTRVWSYHAVNLLIHIAAGLTLFGVARRTLRRGALALALLWTLHPLQTAAVTYVIQRAESLMGLFYLLTLYCFIRYTEGVRAGAWAALAVLACFLGMATKEVMVTAPLIVLLYDRTFVSGTLRRAWGRHGRAHLALASAWLLLAYLVSGTAGRGGTAGFGTELPWPVYALAQGKAISLYLARSLWPHPLVFDYGPASSLRLNGFILPAALVLALLTGTALALAARNPGTRAVGFAGAWFFLILAPSSSVLPIASQIVAEHRMYLPLAAVIGVAVAGLMGALGQRSPAAIAVLAVVLAAATVRRNEVYRSALALWTDTVAACPGNARAHFNLAVELGRLPGRQQEALAQYEAALQIDPNYAEANYNLAVELGRLPGRAPEAIAHYEKTLQIDPANSRAHYNLAAELARIPGCGPEAIAHARAAIRLEPGWAQAHNILGIELSKVPGRQIEAAAEFSEALRLEPGWAEAHGNLAVVLAQIPGRQPEAVAHYEEALRLKPDYVEAHYNLANELARDPHRLAEAIEHYEAALRINPGLIEGHVNAAVSYAKMGRLDPAVRHLEEALRLNPNLPRVRDALAKLQAAHEFSPVRPSE